VNLEGKETNERDLKNKVKSLETEKLENTNHQAQILDEIEKLRSFSKSID